MLIMNENQKYFIELSRAAIEDDIPELPPIEIDWDYILKISEKQNVSGLISYAVLKLPQNAQPSGIEKWEDAMLETFVVLTGTFIDFEDICAALNDKGINLMCLKGGYVREFYPSPELRTMGDIDLLVAEKDFEETCELFRSCGYTEYRQPLCSTFSNERMTTFEIFTSLEEEFHQFTEEMDNRIKTNSTHWKNNISIMSPTDMFAYSIIHTAKHFVHEGCGIRSILDAVLIYKNLHSEIDLNEVRELCKMQGYEKILDYMLCAMSDYYDISIENSFPESENTEEFITYFIEDGVFGDRSDSGMFASHIINHDGGKFMGLMRVFFPPISMLKHKYTYLKKLPALLPAAWIHRFFVAVFCEKKSLSRMNKDLQKGLNAADTNRERLRSLNIK